MEKFSQEYIMTNTVVQRQLGGAQDKRAEEEREKGEPEEMCV